MKIAITGAMGMLGTDMVSELLHRGYDVVALYHRNTARRGQKPGCTECGQVSHQLDITDLKAVRESIASIRPDAVVNCAAYTRVDDAEADKDSAFAVNALGPRNIALACREMGSALLHISTDYVFSGDRDGAYSIWDPPCPVNVYGMSKLWGENYVRSLMGEYYIVRTSWLFGMNGRNFVQTMLELGRNCTTRLTGGECLGLKAESPGQIPLLDSPQPITAPSAEKATPVEATTPGRVYPLRRSQTESRPGVAPLRVVSDQRGSPTYTVDLAKACADLLETRCFGIYHVTNQGVTTWYEFAKSIFEKAGLVVDVLSVTSDEFSRPAKRPKNSALDPLPLRETIGYLLPPWEDALGRYLRQLGLGVDVSPGV